MSRFLLAILLLFPLSIKAEDYWPDRVYLNFATQHFGLGEEVFGVDGPNQFNPGIGLGWDSKRMTFRYYLGLYSDSYKHPTVTLGISNSIINNENWDLALGVAVTKSLSGDQYFEFKNGPKLVEERFYAWPYVQFEYKNAYTQLRAAVNRDGELAGVFAFGLRFDVDEMFGR